MHSTKLLLFVLLVANVGLLLAKECKEMRREIDGFCFYNSKEDTGAIKYICNIPFIACNATVCTECVGVIKEGISIAALVIACISTATLALLVVITLLKKRSS